MRSIHCCCIAMNSCSRSARSFSSRCTPCRCGSGECETKTRRPQETKKKKPAHAHKSFKALSFSHLDFCTILHNKLSIFLSFFARIRRGHAQALAATLSYTDARVDERERCKREGCDTEPCNTTRTTQEHTARETPVDCVLDIIVMLAKRKKHFSGVVPVGKHRLPLNSSAFSTPSISKTICTGTPLDYYPPESASNSFSHLEYSSPIQQACGPMRPFVRLDKANKEPNT